MENGRVLEVAAAQIAVTTSVPENQERVVSVIRSCASEGVDLVLFPEWALTGHDLAFTRDATSEIPEATEHALAAIFCAARAHGIWVVVGATVRRALEWVNRLYVCSSSGEIAAVYDKMHLTVGELPYLVPGASTVTFEIGETRVGLQICYDICFVEGCRALLAQGAEVILCGFYGAGPQEWKLPVLSAHLRSRAAENGCFVVAANVAGPNQVVVSQAFDPFGVLLAEAGRDCEQIVRARLDLARVEESTIRRAFLARLQDLVYR